MHANIKLIKHIIFSELLVVIKSILLQVQVNTENIFRPDWSPTALFINVPKAQKFLFLFYYNICIMAKKYSGLNMSEISSLYICSPTRILFANFQADWSKDKKCLSLGMFLKKLNLFKFFGSSLLNLLQS